MPDSFVSLLAAWNEKDVDLIRGHLDKALAPQIVFCDPNYLIEGVDAFEKMVRDFTMQYPVSRCEHTSGLDAHHNRYRYKWLVSVNNKPAVAGMDVVELDGNGLISRIDGFFGPFPKQDA